jgi:hypothetical protein
MGRSNCRHRWSSTAAVGGRLPRVVSAHGAATAASGWYVHGHSARSDPEIGVPGSALSRQSRTVGLAFFTDADLLARRLTGEGTALVGSAIATSQIGPLMEETAFSARQSGLTAAHHSFLDACSGPGWIAAGDASISFAPISSQGLLHALFSGLSAAEAADKYLMGEPEALDLYRRVLGDIKHVYASRVAAYYATETRWTAAPFWQRRR